jgi:hypothetical protein
MVILMHEVRYYLHKRNRKLLRSKDSNTYQRTAA